MLGNEVAECLTSALNRFDAEKLTEALDRHTAAMESLTACIDLLIRSLPARPEEAEPEKKPNPFAVQR